MFYQCKKSKALGPQHLLVLTYPEIVEPNKTQTTIIGTYNNAQEYF